MEHLGLCLELRVERLELCLELQEEHLLGPRIVRSERDKERRAEKGLCMEPRAREGEGNVR